MIVKGEKVVMTKAGGSKTRKTIDERYGKDYWRKIGSKGGKATGMKGFALNPELARIAGKKGGTKSTRAGIKNGEGKKRVNK